MSTKTDRDRRDHIRREMVQFLFDAWASSDMLNHPRSRLDDRRAKVLGERLTENQGDPDEILWCFEGAKKDEFRTGRDPKVRGVRWDGVEYICQDRSTLERYAEMNPEYRRNEKHPLYAQWQDRLNKIDPQLFQELKLKVV